MIKLNEELLIEVLSVQSSSYKEENMVAYIHQKLKEIKRKSAGNMAIENDSDGNILVTKGESDIYPCVVSHMDTVHGIYKGYKVEKAKHKKTRKNILYATCNTEQGGRTITGVGGDDKVGIYVCLEMLVSFDNIKVVFFTNEEVGCIGSRAIDLSFFNDVSFIWQADRKGNNEVITEDANGILSSDEFINKIVPIMDRYGYSSSDKGVYTDASQLSSRNVGVCCANIACGYYDAHTDNEYVVSEEVETCLSLFYDVIDACGDRRWLHENKGYYDSYSYNDWGSNYDYNSSWKDIDEDEELSLEGNIASLGSQRVYLQNSFDCPCKGGGKAERFKSTLTWTCNKCQKEILNEEIIIQYLETWEGDVPY